MKKIWIYGLTIIGSFSLLAQEEEESLGAMVDRVTYGWDTEAENLEYYDGLLKFCKDKEYRESTIALLNEIHHTDSVLYERAKVAQKRSSDKEIEKLIKSIEKFEEKYSMRTFIKFLSTECKSKKALEKESDDLKTEVGSDSYDGQAYIMEVEMQKFVKHITKRVDLIRKHVHKLNIQ